jgi:hypothetical protein
MTAKRGLLDVKEEDNGRVIIVPVTELLDPKPSQMTHFRLSPYGTSSLMIPRSRGSFSFVRAILGTNQICAAHQHVPIYKRFEGNGSTSSWKPKVKCRKVHAY